MSEDLSTKIIPHPLKEILVNLDVIAQIKPKHKLNVYNKDFADAKSWVDAGWRFFYRETKENSVNFVEKSIEDGINAIKDYNEFIALIEEYLYKTVGGLDVLIDVYSDFPPIVSRLNIAKSNIERMGR